MRSDLLEYYETELRALRTMGAEFARTYPTIAERLQLDAKQSADPHVERLLQGFAFLAARVQLKIDDDFPEISEALLNVVYPHYLRPIPAMTIVQFDLDPDKGKLPSGYRIPAGRELLSRHGIREEVAKSAQRADAQSTRCRFRTCYDTTVWPLAVQQAEWLGAAKLPFNAGSTGASAAFKLTLRAFPDASFSTMMLDSLRFYIDGAGHLPFTVYELLSASCSRILIRNPSKPSSAPLELPVSALRPVGFGADEGMLPYARRSFLGYRNLQEYFAFPKKFMFFDLGGLEALRMNGFDRDAEVFFILSGFERPQRTDRFEADIRADTFRLGCTPAINLFEVRTEPMRLDQRSSAYQLIADDYHLRSTHIFSIEEVRLREQTKSAPIEPLYSLARRAGSDAKAYWVARRRPSVSRRESQDSGDKLRTTGEFAPDDPSAATELWLSFIDLAGRTVDPDADAFDATVTCFNGDLPSRLSIGTTHGTANDFDMPGGGPFRKLVALTIPSQVVQPPLGKSQLWRLISMLSLNYASLTTNGPEALRAILRLHNTDNSPSWSAREHIDGIVDVKTSPHYTRIVREDGAAFARGQRIDIEFDEEKFEGAGAYLFASVLERFLGLYVSINSYAVVAARSRQRREPIYVWRPRSGWKTTL